jgi:hypothetical protein
VNGTNSLTSSEVNFNGKAERSALVSSNQLSATIPANVVAVGGTAAITVSNVPLGGGTSGAAPFTVNDFRVSSAGAASVKSGSSAAIPVTITPSNGNGFQNSVALSISGLPPNVTASFNPASLTPVTGPARATLTFTARAATSVMLRTPLGPGPLEPRIWLGFGLGAAVLILTLRLGFSARPKWLFCAGGFAGLLLVSAHLFSGCNTSASSAPAPNPSPQSYSLTIKGQSGLDTKSTSLTLTVE